MGRMIMAKSVTMFMAALQNHMMYWLKQLEGFRRVQNVEMGRQAKTLPITVQMPYARTTRMSTQHACWNLLETKTRLYCRMTESLIKVSDR